MKKIALITIALVSTIATAQSVSFENLRANDGSNKYILWSTSNLEQGFGHRIINNDQVSRTLLNFQARNNTSNWSNVMTITSEGNVGIGTINPLAKLNVSGNGIRADRFSLSNINDRVNDSPWYGLGRSNFNDLSDNQELPATQLAGYQGLLLKTKQGVFAIKQNGNVGIGTTNPDAKLTINGKIHTKEIKVDLAIPAPDYVFKKEYNLLSIEEVQKYILKNGHLPNIPAAKTMESNGVELGAMNMKLLEKIEELTLYTISQQEALKTQQEKNNILELD